MPPCARGRGGARERAAYAEFLTSSPNLTPGSQAPRRLDLAVSSLFWLWSPPRGSSRWAAFAGLQDELTAVSSSSPSPEGSAMGDAHALVWRVPAKVPLPLRGTPRSCPVPTGAQQSRRRISSPFAGPRVRATWVVGTARSGSLRSWHLRAVRGHAAYPLVSLCFSADPRRVPDMRRVEGGFKVQRSVRNSSDSPSCPAAPGEAGVQPPCFQCRWFSTAALRRTSAEHPSAGLCRDPQASPPVPAPQQHQARPSGCSAPRGANGSVGCLKDSSFSAFPCTSTSVFLTLPIHAGWFVPPWGFSFFPLLCVQTDKIA